MRVVCEMIENKVYIYREKLKIKIKRVTIPRARSPMHRAPAMDARSRPRSISGDRTPDGASIADALITSDKKLIHLKLCFLSTGNYIYIQFCFN